MKISETPNRLRVIINNIIIHNMTNLQETSVKNLDIKKGEARCISNIIVENKANLSIKSGSLLCVIKEN